MMKVLATDGTSPEGVACIKSCAQLDIKPALKPEELLAIIGDYEGLIVRSASTVTAQVIEAGKK
jgi:D-3-phosphoglycerate dehydrogenase